MVRFIKEKLKGEYSKTFISVGATMVGGMILNYGISALLSNQMSVADFGIWSYTFQTIVMVLIVIGLYGNGNFLMRELIKHIANKNVLMSKRVVRESLSFSVLFSAVAVILFFLARNTLYSEGLLDLRFFAGVAIATLALTFGRLRQAYQQATGQNAISQLPERIIQPSIFIALVVFYLGADDSWLLEDVIVIYAVASGIAFAVGLLPLKRLIQLPDFKGSDAIQAENTVPNQKVSRKHFFLLSLVDIIDTNIDLFLLKTFEGFEEVAFYSVAKRVASVVNMILFAANYSFSPIANKLLATGKKDILQEKIYKIVRLNIILGSALVLVLILLKNPLLSLFGEVYKEGIGLDLYVLLLLSQWFNLALGMPGVLLNATGNERFALYTFTGCILLQALLAAWLIPILGVVGMAIIYCFIILFWNLVLGVMAKRKTGVRSTFFI